VTNLSVYRRRSSFKCNRGSSTFTDVSSSRSAVLLSYDLTLSRFDYVVRVNRGRVFDVTFVRNLKRKNDLFNNVRPRREYHAHIIRVYPQNQLNTKDATRDRLKGKNGRETIYIYIYKSRRF